MSVLRYLEIRVRNGSSQDLKLIPADKQNGLIYL